MRKSDKKNEAIFYKSLKKHGFIIPIEEGDVDAFEHQHKDLDIPDDLPDAQKILQKGYSVPKLVSGPLNQASMPLSYAARNGKEDELSEDVKEKMKSDKERDKKKN